MSDIVCSCSACNARFKVGGQFAGKKARCPKCATVVDIPVEGVLLSEETEVASSPQVSVRAPVTAAATAKGGSSGSFPALRTAAPIAVAESKPSKKESSPALDFPLDTGNGSGGFELKLNSAPQPTAAASAPTSATSKAKTGVQPAVSNNKKAAANAAPPPPTQKQKEERKLRFFILAAVAGALLIAVLFVGGLLLLLQPGKSSGKKATATKKATTTSKMPLSKAAAGTKAPTKSKSK
ncbi:hypothetical protein [Anatilimnocola floriformis]|uniref:hypothetical protein n=1 Tax=Anatilimnocola floriformis TaxID=2948575 RepID=UPI0020C2859C|nr:hypothetical protein [Anatilimnocola floriformis]